MDKRTRFSLGYFLWIFLLFWVLEGLFFSGPAVPEISYSAFLSDVGKGKVATVVLTDQTIYGELKGPTDTEAEVAAQNDSLAVEDKATPWRFSPGAIASWFSTAGDKVEQAEEDRAAKAKLQFTVVPLKDTELLDLLATHDVEFRAKIENNFLRNLFFDWIVPFGILFLIWTFIMKRMSGGAGGGMMNVGKSKAKIYEMDAESRIHFSDLAGVDEAIEEVAEVVSFLKEPEKYQRLGAKLPTGVLIVGPPGTGKTLLAKAVAGEAEVPFFSLSGSDFVEMFVGVGASRVRDLFKDAAQKAPCIVFIDELDAIGRARGGRGAAGMGGFDERENTLNQLLVEMDGFDGRTGVVIMAATNRPEVLDRALLRPGRFDRQILVDRPEREGRIAIYRIHSKGLIIGPDVNFDKLGAQTPGFVGADIANICNEAALLGSRNGHDAVLMSDFQDAIERVIGGLEKKGRILNESERRRVAYHESGHALVGYFTPGADPVEKVSIVPRGRGALGYTLQAPTEDRYLMTRDDLLGRVRTLLAGRACEETIFGDISTGASDDLEKASQLVRSMLTVYGMSTRLPNLSLVEPGGETFLGFGPQQSEHSAEISRLLGEEHLEILKSCYDEGLALLAEHREKLEALAERLLDREKVDSSDLKELLGPRPE
ncbi:MAG: ATP-dependent zinc metalloprotease FtsH [Deltaproteobacteria bacterium]